MSPESIVFFNLIFYLGGFILLLSLNNSIFKEFSGGISIILSILGIIFSSSLELPSTEYFYVSYKWLHLGNTQIDFKILIDNQTYFMYFLVQIIAFFVNLFSLKYLEEDAGKNRFFAFLNLFIFSMLGLILAGNIFQLYFFWELVGFCSFLLIGFWYTKKSANSAAIKAFLINRIGDAFLLAGIFLIYYLFGTLDFDVLWMMMTMAAACSDDVEVRFGSHRSRRRKKFVPTIAGRIGLHVEACNLNPNFVHRSIE